MPQRPVALVTGTTHGIGRVTARELARAGFDLVMLCRNLKAAAAVRGDILALAPSAAVRVLHCDLASLQSVRSAAAEVCANLGPLDLLINNAGLVSMRQQLSPDGFELDFAANHLGPFLLTALLLERMAGGGRIVTVASRAHVRGIMDLEHVEGMQPHYRALAAYSRSKLANVMHTFALARRLAGSGVTVNCLHPGVVATHLLKPWVRLLQRLARRVVFDEERGARTTLHLALSKDVSGISGRYFDEHQRIADASPIANDLKLQERLWAKSAEWTGLTAPQPARVRPPSAAV